MSCLVGDNGAVLPSNHHLLNRSIGLSILETLRLDGDVLDLSRRGKVG